MPSSRGIFPTQGSNPGLPHCWQILYHLSHQGSPSILEWVAYPFSRGSSQPRNWTGVSCMAGRFFTNWASLSWDYKNWLENCRLSPACQEVGPLHLQCLYYLYCLLLINSLPSEMLCLEILLQPELGLPWQSSRRAWAATLGSQSGWTLPSLPPMLLAKILAFFAHRSRIFRDGVWRK